MFLSSHLSVCKSIQAHILVTSSMNFDLTKMMVIDLGLVPVWFHLFQ